MMVVIHYIWKFKCIQLANFGLGQQKPYAQQDNMLSNSILCIVSVMKSSGLFLARLQIQLAQMA